MTTLYIVDDDEPVRKALARLFLSACWQVHCYASVEEFIKADKPDTRACVIADIRMPGIGGLSLPELLANNGLHFPIIFLSSQDTEEVRNAANKAGVVAFFRKPVDDQALIDTIEWAMRKNNNHPDQTSFV